MKVLFCANDKEGTTIGGPDIWIRRIVFYLKDKGINIHLCFFFFGELENCNNINFLKNKGIPISTISNNEFPYTERRVLQFLKIIEKIQPDIIVGNLCVPVLYASAFLKKYNIPVIPVLHANNEFYKGIIEEFITKKGKYNIENIVTVSKFLAEQCSQNRNTKVSVISCGTEVPSIKTTPPTKVLNVVYIGRFRQWQKRIYDVTKAFCKASHEVPNTNYFFYGYGPEGEEEKMKDIITQYDAEDKVFIKGLLDNADLKKDLGDKHIVVLMSDYEGLPMALIEAMAVGLVPICLSEESGVNEVVSQNKNGLLIHDRDQDFINAIQYIKNNTSQWISMSEYAKETVINKYSNQVEDNKWLELFSNLKQDQKSNKTEFVCPEIIKLPRRNSKINEDVRGPQPPSFFASLRKKIGVRTRIRKLFTRII